MHKKFLIIAAILGAISVGAGAFGAHGLKSMLPGEDLSSFETAVRYQMYHVSALILVAILYKEYNRKLVVWAGWMFFAGIILFSGSLYLITVFKILETDNYNWIGAVTPVGGITFIAGWILTALSVSQKN